MYYNEIAKPYNDDVAYFVAEVLLIDPKSLTVITHRSVNITRKGLELKGDVEIFVPIEGSYDMVLRTYVVPDIHLETVKHFKPRWHFINVDVKIKMSLRYQNYKYQRDTPWYIKLINKFKQWIKSL